MVLAYKALVPLCILCIVAVGNVEANQRMSASLDAALDAELERVDLTIDAQASVQNQARATQKVNVWAQEDMEDNLGASTEEGINISAEAPTLSHILDPLIHGHIGQRVGIMNDVSINEMQCCFTAAYMADPPQAGENARDYADETMCECANLHDLHPDEWGSMVGRKPGQSRQSLIRRRLMAEASEGAALLAKMGCNSMQSSMTSWAHLDKTCY